MVTTSVEPEEPEDSWAVWKEGIKARLNRDRPKRYDHTDRDWMVPTDDWARLHMPDVDLVRRHAETIVRQLEGLATKEGNRLIRAWNKGQRPLFWGEIGPLPVKVTNKLRVRLDAATPEDEEDAALLRSSEAKRTFDEVLGQADAERDLARAARLRGLDFIYQLGDLAPRGEGGGILPWEGPDDFGNPGYEPYEDDDE